MASQSFAVRFQTQYAGLRDTWKCFALGETPDTFPPGWRGVNYYASVFSHEKEENIGRAAQKFLNELEAAKFDARTYIARLTLATQTFARAVCQCAGIEWETKPVPREAPLAEKPLALPPVNLPAPPLASPAPKRAAAPAKPVAPVKQARRKPVASTKKTKPAQPKSQPPTRKTKSAKAKPGARKPATAKKPAARKTKPAKAQPGARKPATAKKPATTKKPAQRQTPLPRPKRKTG